MDMKCKFAFHLEAVMLKVKVTKKGAMDSAHQNLFACSVKQSYQL